MSPCASVGRDLVRRRLGRDRELDAARVGRAGARAARAGARTAASAIGCQSPSSPSSAAGRRRRRTSSASCRPRARRLIDVDDVDLRAVAADAQVDAPERVAARSPIRSTTRSSPASSWKPARVGATGHRQRPPGGREDRRRLERRQRLARQSWSPARIVSSASGPSFSTRRRTRPRAPTARWRSVATSIATRIDGGGGASRARARRTSRRGWRARRRGARAAPRAGPVRDRRIEAPSATKLREHLAVAADRLRRLDAAPAAPPHAPQNAAPSRRLCLAVARTRLHASRSIRIRRRRLAATGADAHGIVGDVTVATAMHGGATMADATRCPSARRNDAGSSFCSACGASLAAHVHCPSCNTLNPLGQPLLHALRRLARARRLGRRAAPTGARDRWRVGARRRRDDPPRRSRGRARASSARAPCACRPARSASCWSTASSSACCRPASAPRSALFERIANFFLRPRAHRVLPRRSADRSRCRSSCARGRRRRPGRARSQVLVTFTLPRGDRDGARAASSRTCSAIAPAFTTGDLYNLLRPEVVRVAQDALERAVAASPDGRHLVSRRRGRRSARRSTGAVGPRYGLTVDATLAPLTAVASLTLHLGTGAAPQVRPCASCRRELPVSLRFCDRCGAKQPAVVVGGDADSPRRRRCSPPTASRSSSSWWCACRASTTTSRPTRIAPALVGAAAAHLRDAPTFAALTGPGGFAALEQAMAPAIARGAGQPRADAGRGRGRRRAHQDRATGCSPARADLERAREDVRLGLSWLEQRDTELDLEAARR